MIGLTSWVVVIIIGSWSAEHRQLVALPSSVAPGTALAASTKVDVASLPGGPIGGLLPAGSLSPAGTYGNSYSRGQCTWYVASRRPIPSGWGNANMWYSRAKAAGWSVGTVPAIGAIAWTGAGYYGHVAVVVAVSGTQVQVAEMNYNGPYRVDQRWTNATNWRYIY